MEPDIKELIGKTMASVSGAAGEDEMIFTTTDGDRFIFYHSQGCCESVAIESIVGDLTDLVGEPILKAEEVSSEENPQPNEYSESWTWTFYKFATRKGYVDVRWLGESNGYYSESVDLKKVAA